MASLTRRDFVASLAGAAALGGTARLAAQDKPMPKKKLGKSGLEVSVISLGGWHLGSVENEKEAEALVRRAHELGINFFDSAWSYQAGRSERHLGRALKGIRDQVLLMSKSEERTREGAMRQIDETLKRMQTDRLDLWQFHAMQSADDAEKIFKKGGAMEAAEEALKAGKILHLGATGHRDPAAHMRVLDDPRIETIQMPVNALDFHFESFQKGPFLKAKEKGVGRIAMKTCSSGNAISKGAYTVDEALRYVWTLGPDVLVSGMATIEHLEHNVALAKAFTPMSDDEKKAVLDKCKALAGTDIEWYKKRG